MTDLWPGDFVEKQQVRAPVTIMKEQAALLGSKTNNLVLAEVTSLPRQVPTFEGRVVVHDNDRREDFRYGFYLVAPALEDYRYRLFIVANDIRLYPVSVYPDEGGEQGERANDDKEFEELLKRIFHSARTQRLITAMLAQSAGTADYDVPF